MKNFKRIAVIGAILMALGVTSIAALAVSGYSKPAEIVSGLTGKPIESVIAEKTESGKTYGAIANEANKLDEFKAQMLAKKVEILKEKVSNGTMTQERADAIVAALEANQANCDGTCTGGSGAKMGTGNGCRNGRHERKINADPANADWEFAPATDKSNENTIRAQAGVSLAWALFFI